MKPTFAAALLASLLAVSATPASACFLLRCMDEALADDAYPPGESPLSPAVQVAVHERHGKGMSLAGFYNDPSVSMRERAYEPAVFAPAPAPEIYAPAPVEPANAPAEPEYGYERHRGPHVVVSPYGRRHHDRRSEMRHDRDGHRVY